MFRISSNKILLINNLFKTNSKSVRKIQNYKCDYKLTYNLSNKVFYSKGIFWRLSPLYFIYLSEFIFQIHGIVFFIFIIDMKDVHDKITSEPKLLLSRVIAKDSLDNFEIKQDDKEEATKKKEQSWKHMKYTLIVFGASMVSIGIYLLIELGKPKRDENGDIIHDQFSDMPVWKQYIKRTLSELNYYEKVFSVNLNFHLYHCACNYCECFI